MKKLILTMLTISASLAVEATPITSAGDSALTGGTVITFSEQAHGSAASFTFGDVTFSATGSNSLRLENNPCVGSCIPNTGDTLANQTSGISGASFTVDFASTISAFGFGAAAQNSSLSVSAFDLSNSLIESFDFSGSCCAFEFGGIAAAGISSLLISTTDYMAFDNFTYVAESSSVPEPAMFALMGLGLVGIGFSRKIKAA